MKSPKWFIMIPYILISLLKEIFVGVAFRTISEGERSLFRSFGRLFGKSETIGAAIDSLSLREKASLVSLDQGGKERVIKIAEEQGYTLYPEDLAAAIKEIRLPAKNGVNGHVEQAVMLAARVLPNGNSQSAQVALLEQLEQRESRKITLQRGDIPERMLQKDEEYKVTTLTGKKMVYEGTFIDSHKMDDGVYALRFKEWLGYTTTVFLKHPLVCELIKKDAGTSS